VKFLILVLNLYVRWRFRQNHQRVRQNDKTFCSLWSRIRSMAKAKITCALSDHGGRVLIVLMQCWQHRRRKKKITTFRTFELFNVFSVPSESETTTFLSGKLYTVSPYDYVLFFYNQLCRQLFVLFPRPDDPNILVCIAHVDLIFAPSTKNTCC